MRRRARVNATCAGRAVEAMARTRDGATILIAPPRSSALRSRYFVKLNGKEYVPPPALDEGNLHDWIFPRMQLSVSEAPAPPHVRLLISTPVTLPEPVRVIATLIVPARDGFVFNPYS